MKDFARINDSIIGWGSSVGKWARIDNKSVIGEDVHVKVLNNSCASSLATAFRNATTFRGDCAVLWQSDSPLHCLAKYNLLPGQQPLQQAC